MILVIDNYDSFVYNLVQYLGELGCETVVRRNDSLRLEDVETLGPTHVVVSPGPCTPLEAGLSNDIIGRFGGRVPILGVCLGHQCIGHVYGGRVDRADRIMHGKTSAVSHDGRGIFLGVPSPFQATRYHSLVVRDEQLPACLEVSARSEWGEIMALR
ncbi:MAG: aminodeoxychorismate/anthranilate synthase component II, partial [Chloroflexi bacterium]|nr:aminodeoxychorismate/anthranilate synthase component II [Chloroflexota bacterium]